MLPVLTVSIVSHNSRDDLKALMPSLTKSLKGINTEILVVDNLSEDGSAEFLTKAYPEVRLTVNAVRKGYGANHNTNLNKARGKYIVFMNADIILMEDTMVRLKDFMERNGSVGICCPNVLNEDGSLQFLNKRHPTVLDLFLRRFQMLFPKRVVERRSCYYEMRDAGYDQSMDIPFISGCFMFCRTRVIKAVQGFDERFFLYFEDVDLCRKVQARARTVSCPEARLVHRWHRSSHKQLKWFFVFLKSGFLYFNKWGYMFF